MNKFKRGDKVTHKIMQDEDLIGTIMSCSEKTCLVRFVLPARKNKKYISEVEILKEELSPRYIKVPEVS